MRTVLAALVALSVCGLPTSVAQAVTFGTPVTNAATSSPWVVRILFSDAGTRSSDAYLMCSGSLLDAQTVITAAHCVDDSTLTNGYYYVQPAGVIAGMSHRTIVDSAWYNPSFDTFTLRGDVALLHLATPIHVRSYAHLPTTATVPHTLHLMGFGVNEAGGLPGQLWTTPMHPATKSEIAMLGVYNAYDAATMLIAANHYGATYSGGCHGDSGGPLVATVHGQPTLYGVVSWGNPVCLGAASAFARVSALKSAIASGRSQLAALTRTNYRGRPENIVRPSISGVVAAGSTLTCNPGTWTNHPGTFAYRWYTQDGVPGTDSPAATTQHITLGPTDVNYPVQCVVLSYSALNANNYNVQDVYTNTSVAPLVLSVSIDNNSSTIRKQDSVWTCAAGAGALTLPTSLINTRRTFSWSDSAGIPLPNTKHLTWTSGLISAIPNGSTVTCTITVQNAHSGGTVSTGTSPATVVN